MVIGPRPGLGYNIIPDIDFGNPAEEIRQVGASLAGKLAEYGQALADLTTVMSKFNELKAQYNEITALRGGVSGFGAVHQVPADIVEPFQYYVNAVVAMDAILAPLQGKFPQVSGFTHGYAGFQNRGLGLIPLLIGAVVIIVALIALGRFLKAYFGGGGDGGDWGGGDGDWGTTDPGAPWAPGGGAPGVPDDGWFTGDTWDRLVGADDPRPALPPGERSAIFFGVPEGIDFSGLMGPNAPPLGSAPQDGYGAVQTVDLPIYGPVQYDLLDKNWWTHAGGHAIFWIAVFMSLYGGSKLIGSVFDWGEKGQTELE